MDFYNILPIHETSAEKIFLDNGVDLSKVESIICYKDFNDIFINKNICHYSDALKSILDCSLAYPLFLSEKEKEDAIKYHQNYLMVKSFLNIALFEENNDDTNFSFSDDNVLFKIKNGEYVIKILGEKILFIDHEKYGFSDVFQMVYVLGAFLSNKIIFRDAREIKKNIADGFYFYGNHIHGDFRLSKYQDNVYTSVDPIDGRSILPFAKPELKGQISGYHSIETYFLSNLLSFLYLNESSCEVIDNFDEFIDNLKSDGQTYGNYGDAGSYDSLCVTMGFSGIESNRLQAICTDPCSDNFYLPVMEENKLNIYLKKTHQEKNENIAMVISINDVNEVISGLFEKVAKGNGRSSIFALEDTMNYYRAKYLNVDRKSLNFNLRLSDLFFEDY